MRVAFWLPHLNISGGVRVILTYAKLLSGLDYEVTVIGTENSRKLALLRNLFKLKPRWFILPKSVRVVWLPDSRVETFFKKNRFDIIVADSWPVARKVYDLKTSAQKIHTIQHDERLYHGDSEQVAQIYALPMKKLVVSTWLKEMLERDFNQESELLLNSFDQQLFQPRPEVRTNDGLVRVLILDHSYEWKGTKEAVQMVKELKEKYPNLRLMAFGARRSDPQFDYDEFYFSPHQADLAKIYSRADIFLCASWDEGFGLPSLEAMACGAAVVTYDNGGSRDFAFDEETALVAPRLDYESLKNNLERLITDKDLRDKIASSGYRLTQTWPTWAEQAQKLEKILKSAITL